MGIAVKCKTPCSLLGKSESREKGMLALIFLFHSAGWDVLFIVRAGLLPRLIIPGYVQRYASLILRHFLFQSGLYSQLTVTVPILI